MRNHSETNVSGNEKFRTNPNRVKHRAELIPILQEALLTETSNHWGEQCRANNIPCGTIQNLKEVEADPQLIERKMFITAEHPKAGEMRMIGSPLKLSRTPVATRHHPPDAGEHNEEILHSIGYKEEEIKLLKNNKII